MINPRKISCSSLPRAMSLQQHIVATVTQSNRVLNSLSLKNITEDKKV